MVSEQEVSLIFPFDIGRSYIFYVEPQGDARASGVDVKIQWEKIFTRQQGKLNWTNEQLPETFNKPLGFRAHSILSRSNSRGAEIETFLLALDGISWGATKQPEVTVFPFGIGALLLRLKSKRAVTSLREAYWDDREKIQEKLGPLLQSIAAEVRRIFDAEVRRKEIPPERCGCYLHEIVDVRREKFIKTATHSYPIFFSVSSDDFASEAKEDRKKARIQKASGEASGTIDEVLEEISDGQVGYDFHHWKTGEDANVYVGWAQSFACCAMNPPIRKVLEDVFLIAMISWYSLIIMNEIASLYLLEAFKDMASNRSQILKQKSRVMRLTFMDAASSSRPIRWTLNEQELWLLEYAHKTWSSERLWTQIEEQTRTLASHHDQLEEEEGERKTSVLAFLALVIAGLAVISAFADERSLLKSGYLYALIDTSGWFLGLLIPALGALFLILFWYWRPVRQKWNHKRSQSVDGKWKAPKNR